MNRLEWAEKKLASYKTKNYWYRKFQKKWFGICDSEVVTLGSIISLQKNIFKMMMEDLK